jgi:hypothetical protein
MERLVLCSKIQLYLIINQKGNYENKCFDFIYLRFVYWV